MSMKLPRRAEGPPEWTSARQFQSIAAPDATHEKGGAPGGGRLENVDMLSIAEKPSTGKFKTAQPIMFHTVSDVRKAAVWLDEQVAAANGQATGQIVTLTPALAAVLLERNAGNRKLRESKVADFAKDIANGAWKLNGEPIIVASDGTLNNGQHRCSAVIESKAPIDTMLIVGVDRETRDTLDQGLVRTPADYLSFHGQTDTNNLAAAGRFLWQWRKLGFVSTHGRYFPTKTELVRIVLDNPGLKKSLLFINRPNSRVFGSRSVLAFCHFAFKSGSDESVSDESVSNEPSANFFMDSLIDGEELKRGNPILYVRNKITAERKLLTTASKVELLFRAWNAHRLEENRTLIRLSGGPLPKLEA